MKLSPWVLVVLVLLPACDGVARDDSKSALVREAKSDFLSVRVAVDRQEMTTAEQLELSIEATLKDGAVLSPLTLKDQLEGWSLGEVKISEPEFAGEGLRTLRRFALRPFLAGDYQIPALKITAKSADGKVQRGLTTPAIPIKVRSVLSEGELEPAAIEGVVENASRPWAFAWLLVLASLGLLGLVLVMRYRKVPVERIEVPRPSTRQLALRRLEELWARRENEGLAVEGFYHELSMLLRRYVEERFAVPAGEMTTAEFLRELKANGRIPDAAQGTLEPFFVHCDEVRFSGAEASAEQLRASYETVRDFVQGEAG